jgi:rhamnose utilization protein RhaD (predicted bifunctional aldolase and dehydrogenase)
MSNSAATGSRFNYVKYLWSDEEAEKLDGVDRLVYRSNRLGDDLSLTNTGGGNTSSKLQEKDPLTGEDVEVLWLKGSGGDLRTAKRDGFASLYLEKVRAMRPLYENDPANGPKSEIEDAMYPMYSHCVYNLNPVLARSIHRFIRLFRSNTSITCIRTRSSRSRRRSIRKS